MPRRLPVGIVAATDPIASLPVKLFRASSKALCVVRATDVDERPELVARLVPIRGRYAATAFHGFPVSGTIAAAIPLQGHKNKETWEREWQTLIEPFAAVGLEPVRDIGNFRWFQQRGDTYWVSMRPTTGT